MRRGSFISPAMIAVRMKPSQAQKKIAAPAMNSSGPFSKVGLRCVTLTCGTAKNAKTINSVTIVSMRLMTTLLVKEMPKELSATPTSTIAPAAR